MQFLKRRDFACLVYLFFLTCLPSRTSADNRRPFYVIAHMVNEIRQVRHYLDRGANSLETDIQFFPNGSVKEAFHGFPCDCFRTCHRSVKLSDYLQHVREITDPDYPGTYYRKMVLQFFDLKSSTSNNKRLSGRDLARHVLEYLWSKDGGRKTEVRVMVYIENVGESDVILGFLEEFKARGVEDRLRDVGFDGGTGSLYAIRNMFGQLGVEAEHVWQGDGKTNCISALASDSRLRQALSVRQSRASFINKVYHWTIDLKFRMRLSLNIGVDGIITNDPEDLVDVLGESYYASDFRLATLEDDPFSKYQG